jgi:serine/threonine-protein kinase
VAQDPAHRPASADALAEQLGVALEQRRELPAALRNFVKRDARINGGGALLLPGILFGVAMLAGYRFGGLAALGTFIAGSAGAPLAYFANAARRLLRMGFAHADVGPAFAVEIERARDEHAIVHGTGTSVTESITKWVGGLSGTVFVSAVWAGIAGVGRSPGGARFVTLGLMLSIPAIASLLLYASSVEQRRDLDTEFWARVWRGRIGRLAFAIGQRFLGRGARTTAVTHRATELSLGMAAESLYQSLPAAARKSLGDLPRVVKRLQNDAQRLRKLYDDLQEAVALAGSSPTSSTYVALRDDRDRVHSQLGAAVAALETIRLNLLRLHAGAGSVEGLTTHVDLAAELSVEVERLLSARDEVERGLSYPRETAPTPA